MVSFIDTQLSRSNDTSKTLSKHVLVDNVGGISRFTLWALDEVPGLIPGTFLNWLWSGCYGIVRRSAFCRSVVHSTLNTLVSDQVIGI